MGLWLHGHARQAPRAPATAQPPSVVFAAPHSALRTTHLALAVVAIAVALAAGWGARSLAGPATSAPEPGAAPADLGAVQVGVAGSWSREPAAHSGVTGLDPRASIAYAPAIGLRAHVVLTLAPIDDPTLVPAPLRALVGRPLPRPQRTALLGVPAWRYPAQPLGGDRMIELTVAATTSGSLTIACIGQSSSWTAAAGCAAGVKRLAIEDARWLAPAQDLLLRRSAPAVIERLGVSRRALRAELRAAPGRRAQSRIAGRLAAAYERAAAALAPSAPAGGPAHELVAALRSSADAHRKLSRAAAAAAPRRYRRARFAIARGDARVHAALAELG